MTLECASAFSQHDLPELSCFVSPERKRGRRECRVLAAPAVSRARCTWRMRTRAYRYSRSIPAFPARWLYGLCRALPGDEFLLPPSLADCRSIETRSGSKNLCRLDASNGRQDHTVLPYAASFAKGIGQPSAGRPRQWQRRLSAVRLSRSRSLTEIRPANSFARLTLLRPSQPVPTFVTMANAPLLGTGWQVFYG